MTTAPPTPSATALPPAVAPAPAAAGAVYAPPDSPAALARLPDDALVAFADGSVRVTAAELRKSLPAIERQVQSSIQPAPASPTAVVPLKLGAGPDAGAGARAVDPGLFRAPQDGAVARIGCGSQQALGSEPAIVAVNGVGRGSVLTPGPERIVITGCGFGAQGERSGVYLFSARNGFLHRLETPEWNDQRIGAYWGSFPGGVQDFDDLTVRIEREDGRRLEQAGHRFVAEREVRVLTGFPEHAFIPLGSRPAPTLLPGDGTYTTLVVDTDYVQDPFCVREFTRVDRLMINGLRFLPGWRLHDVLVRNLTSQLVADVGETVSPITVMLGYDARLQNEFDARWDRDTVLVTPQWHSMYTKKFLWFGGTSRCTSRYAVTVLVVGPKGTWR